jgi:hypothetical protein
MGVTTPGSEADRRRAERHRLRVDGRYLLADRTEWKCQTVDISTTGVLLRGQMPPWKGQTVVVYLPEIGRIEGTAVRLSAVDFALSIQATDRKRAQLAPVLCRLAAGEAPLRRVDPAMLTGQQVSAPAAAVTPPLQPVGKPVASP